MASPASFSASAGRRRRSSAAKHPPPNLHLDAFESQGRLGVTSGSSSVGAHGVHLPTIPGTPGLSDMTSRSPSPRPGGWSEPGLNTPYDTGGGRASPMRAYPNGGSNNVTWASAQAKSAEVKGYGSFNPRQNFFGRHFRRISTSLPFSYAEKEKLGRGRYQGNKIQQILARIGSRLWRLRRSVGLLLVLLLGFILFYATRELSGPVFRRI